jgi:hypothetical protein
MLSTEVILHCVYPDHWAWVAVIISQVGVAYALPICVRLCAIAAFLCELRQTLRIQRKLVVHPLQAVSAGDQPGEKPCHRPCHQIERAIAPGSNGRVNAATSVQPPGDIDAAAVLAIADDGGAGHDHDDLTTRNDCARISAACIGPWPPSTSQKQ